VDFLQIDKTSGTIYSFIDTFEKQRLRAEDMSFDPNDVITRQTCMDRLLPTMPEELQQGARPRTYQHGKRRAKEVVCRD
jgi:hypothetical protein